MRPDQRPSENESYVDRTDTHVRRTPNILFNRPDLLAKLELMLKTFPIPTCANESSRVVLRL